jgi:group I intron endonuclease
MLVYLIRNKLNGKCYVGQTIQPLAKRWRGHCWASSSYGKKMPIANAIQKYGRENFEVEVLEECSTRIDLDCREVHWVLKLGTFYPNGYNLRAGGSSGGIASQDLRDRMRKSMTGKKASEETRRKLSESHMGHVASEETRRKMSAFMKGKQLPALARRNALESTQGTYLLVSIEGELIEVVNMRQFCREHDLSPPGMSLVITGHKLHHKGWQGVRIK